MIGMNRDLEGFHRQLSPICSEKYNNSLKSYMISYMIGLWKGM